MRKRGTHEGKSACSGIRPFVLALSLILPSGCTHAPPPAPPPAPPHPAPVIAAAVPTVLEPLDGQFKPGQSVVVRVKGFNGAGTVLLDGIAHKAVGWTQDHVTIRVPSGPPGRQFVVALIPQGASQAIPAGSITIASSSPAKQGGGAGSKAAGGGEVHPSVPVHAGPPSYSKGLPSPPGSHYIPPNSPR